VLLAGEALSLVGGRDFEAYGILRVNKIATVVAILGLRWGETMLVRFRSNGRDGS
jgi:hypothetical protein